jgi:hypothetical protein
MISATQRMAYTRRSNGGQAFKRGTQEAVATPLCGVFTLAVIADRALPSFGIRCWTLSVESWG